MESVIEVSKDMMWQQMESVIEVSKVQKKFNKFQALDNVSFKVKKGEFFGCFGPNGAGKTTLIRILTGQLPRTGGHVRVLGIDPSKNPVDVKKRIGIVPESESPPSFLTGWEYLYFVAHIRQLPNIESKIKHWLEFFDMTGRESTICKDLSKGMRQKLMLSAALIHEPELLILDEPLINLDPIYQRRVKDHLRGYAKKMTVFMCTHILEAAEKLCGNSVILNKGKIVGRGKIAQLRAKESENLEDIFLRLVE
ncbi:MAG: ABC transporter ATP-binding protein [Candidatus Thermoplasmatota archaeon]|nr:ABC transporter ATP-binding protein [Candidatus Thermoplasmatota archaeon]MDP7264233.1 ABC transporter ATP-binding protein [Candidatus Thermoplasmatota archaeon]